MTPTCAVYLWPCVGYRVDGSVEARAINPVATVA